MRLPGVKLTIYYFETTVLKEASSIYTLNTMGIKGLARYLQRIHPSLYRPISLENLRGKRFAIDTSVLLYNFTINMSYPKEYVDRFVKFSKSLTNRGIPHTFIFDGPACKAKCGTLDRRYQKRAHNLDILRRKITECTALEEEAVAKNATQFMESCTVDLRVVDAIRCRKVLLIKKTLPINRKFLYALQREFEQRRIPFVIADLEAEKTCAWMAQQGLVDFVASEDYDTLVCGAPTMVCSWGAFIHRHQECKVLVLSEVLKRLQLSYEEFVDVCILAGTDFNRTPVIMGFSRALMLLRSCSSADRNLLYLFQTFCRRHYLTSNYSTTGYTSFLSAKELFVSTRFPFIRSILVAIICVWLLAICSSMSLEKSIEKAITFDEAGQSDQFCKTNNVVSTFHELPLPFGHQW